MNWAGCVRQASVSEAKRQMGCNVLSSATGPHKFCYSLSSYLSAVNGNYNLRFLWPSPEPVANQKPPGLPLSVFA